MRRFVIWLIAGIFTVALTAFFLLPATWLAPLVERQTRGQLTLGDAQGTFWNGSAFIGGAPSGNDPVTPLLPGRFSWEISPLLMVGVLDAKIANPAALAQPVNLTGSWSSWQLSPSSLLLPAERLSGLGAPLNTIQPAGEMRLSWNALQFMRENNQIAMTGALIAELNDIASRLSAVRPLGSYKLAMEWHGQNAQLALSTVKGPLLLEGRGALQNGHLQFSGNASAQAGDEDRLTNFLNLLGQHRKIGSKDVIALEFKS